MASVQEIASRIANEEPWPTRAERESDVEETTHVAAVEEDSTDTVSKNKPTRKVASGSIAGAVTVVLAWVGQQYGITLDPEVSSAVTVLVTAVVGFAVPEKS